MRFVPLPELILVLVLASFILGPRTAWRRIRGRVWMMGGIVGIPAVVLVAASSITGNWEVEATFDDSSLSGGGFDCAFKQDGERLTGNCAGGTASLTGEVKGQLVTWQVQARRTQETVTYTGTVDESGTSMKGRFTIGDKGGHFSALKQ